jgi:hypothetical protein
MFTFSCFSVQNYTNVANHSKTFITLFEYIMETCDTILNQLNENIIFKIIH